MTFAYTVPLAGWLRTALPNETARLMPFLQAHLERYEAANELLDRLPVHLHAAFAPGSSFDALPVNDQETVRRVIHEIRKQDPQKILLLETWDTVPEL